MIILMGLFNVCVKESPYQLYKYIIGTGLLYILVHSLRGSDETNLALNEDAKFTGLI